MLLGSAAVFRTSRARSRSSWSHESQCFVVPPPPALRRRGARRAARGLPARGPRAGDLLGRKVLITGSGPIGALTCIATRSAGAARITVTDIAPSRSRSRTASAPTRRSMPGRARAGCRLSGGQGLVRMPPSRRPAIRTRWSVPRSACARAAGSCSSACCLPGRSACRCQAHAQGDRAGRHLPLPRRVRGRGRGPD